MNSALLQALGQLQRLPEALRFERALRHPELAQRQRLAAVVRETADTEFGRAHRLGDVRTLADLQSRVPVQTFADVEPYVARMMRGEPRVLSVQRPIFYATTSGTTGASKRTPITDAFRREHQRSFQISIAHVALRFPRAFAGSVLYFVSKKNTDRAADGTPIGFTSGFIFSSMPAVVQKIYAWPYELVDVVDDRAREYLAAWLAIMSPVTFVGAIFPIAFTQFLRSAEPLAEALVRDLERGTLRDDLALTREERAFFVRFARRDRAAAERLRSEARNAGHKVTAKALLPHLRLVYCWIGASAANYVPELRERLGPDVAIRDAFYGANEAGSTSTLGTEGLGGPLCVTGHVFEFVEEKLWERGERVGIGAEALEPQRRYRMLVTTSAGLHRYDIGDILECSGHRKRTPILHFVRRSGASMSLVGEKLDESLVVQAVGTVLQKMNLRLRYFAVTPIFLPIPHWQLHVEPEAPLAAATLPALRAAFDETLGDLSEAYAKHRRGALGPLSLRVLAIGSFDTDRQRRIDAGAPAAQLKVVHFFTESNALDHFAEVASIR